MCTSSLLTPRTNLPEGGARLVCGARPAAQPSFSSFRFAIVGPHRGPNYPPVPILPKKFDCATLTHGNGSAGSILEFDLPAEYAEV
jgi:hypothetical protein